jgi:hypothetical protein
MNNSNSQDSLRPGLGWSHHLPPYSILYSSPRGAHPNGILSWDSQMRISKLPKLGLSQLWGPITLRADLRLRWGVKQSCSPHQDLFNGMSHVTYKEGNRVDSWLLMVESQIVNLTFGPSFGHNLCFRYLNGSCKSISNIYVPRAFQWYKKLFNPLSFVITFWKSRSPSGSEPPKWKLP